MSESPGNNAPAPDLDPLGNLSHDKHQLLVFAELKPAATRAQLVDLIARIAALGHPRTVVALIAESEFPTAGDQLPCSDAITFLRLKRKPDDAPLGLLVQAFDALSIQPNDVLIRLTIDFDKHDRLRRRAASFGVESLLNPSAIRSLFQAANPANRLGTIATSHTLTAKLGDAAGLPQKLSRTLNLPVSDVTDARYYPQGLYALTGTFLSALIDQRLRPALRNRDKATLMAVDLGLAAIAKSMQFGTVDMKIERPPRPVGAATVNEYTAQLFAMAGNNNRAAEYRPGPAPAAPGKPAIDVIAYYLPQFHPIPENDAWWGTGFTEWHNVGKAVPRFVGHYQPHLPADLGFYDLRQPTVMRQQIDLARAYGIHGFCFYYYWFNGKRLLETPIDNYHTDSTLDLPYCLCWANENWTRRWDGQEREVLIEQEHSARDDIRFIESIEKHLTDPRYIRVDGKPMLLVYRADQFPDARATAERWRIHCRKRGIGEIHLVAVLSFAVSDPRPLGFDAAVEFPPHGLNQPPINHQLPIIDRDFSGNIYDYRDSVIQAADTKYNDRARRPFPVIGACMLSWDNDARRKGKGNTFHHSSPQAYANWLRLAALHGQRSGGPGGRMVFINAWNEWAEGTHLEPDQRYGHAYLTATAETIRLFDDADGDLRPIPPTDLGFSTPLLHLASTPPVQPRDATDVSLYRKRFEKLGRMPTFRIILAFDELDTGVFDTLYTLAEQIYRRIKITVVTPDEFAPEWTQPGPADLVSDSDLLAGINRAVSSCDEEWIVFLEKSDQLLPHSLMVMAERLATFPESVLLYSDEVQSAPAPADQADASAPTSIHLKPEFDRTRLLHTPYLGGLLAVARSALLDVGGLDPATTGLAQHDLALRLLARFGINAIRHLPEILLWRKRRPEDWAGLDEAARQELTEKIAARHLNTEGAHTTPPRRVSIIIPTRNQPARLQRCIESMFEHTADADFELLLVDHRNDDPAARAFLTGLTQMLPDRVRVVPVDGDFNFAAINNHAAREASGEALLFLNDDTAALHPGWLASMLAELTGPETGIVGARLLLPDGRIQHVGITLGLRGIADFCWSGMPMDTPGRDGELTTPREVGAVTGACLLIRTELFRQLGGFDERFSIAYADFDLCLRARQAGWRSVVTPSASLMHEAGSSLKSLPPNEARQASEEFPRQQDLFFRAWRPTLARDPDWHPALSLLSGKAELESNDALRPDPLYWAGLPTVYGLPADSHGSGAYRVKLPIEFAHDQGLIRGRCAGGYPLPVVLERLGIEVIHTQRQVDDAQLATLARTRDLLPVKVIMDFDDLLTEMPDSNFHKKDLWPDIERRIARACSLSDVVTASTAPLADKLRHYHDNVKLVPNAIRREDWVQPPAARQNQTRLRVGWAGGISHAGDLAIIREVVRQLADEVDWIFLGMCLDDMRPSLAEFHKGVDFERYPEKLASLDLDLAIAPLAINAFNECKSNLRLLEYGALGIPVIATDITPYQCGLPVTLLANRPDLWTKSIRDKLTERDALRHEGERLRTAVFMEWTQQQHLDQWMSAWSCH